MDAKKWMEVWYDDESSEDCVWIVSVCDEDGEVQSLDWEVEQTDAIASAKILSKKMKLELFLNEDGVLEKINN